MQNNFYLEYFKRQIPIVGEEGQQKLSSKKVALIGAGGLGGFYAFGLSGCGLEEIYVVDFDTVSLSNIHRQVMFDFNDIDKHKADEFKKLEKRTYTTISPKIMSADDFFATHDDIDLIIDATDNMNARMSISKAAKNLNIPFVYTSVDGFTAQACIYKNKDFRPNNANTIQGQVAPMVMLSASVGAVLSIRYLSGLDVEFDKLYHIDFHKSFNLFSFI